MTRHLCITGLTFGNSFMDLHSPLKKKVKWNRPLVQNPSTIPLVLYFKDKVKQRRAANLALQTKGNSIPFSLHRLHVQANNLQPTAHSCRKQEMLPVQELYRIPLPPAVQ